MPPQPLRQRATLELAAATNSNYHIFLNLPIFQDFFTVTKIQCKFTPKDTKHGKKGAHILTKIMTQMSVRGKLPIFTSDIVVVNVILTFRSMAVRAEK